MPWSEIFHRGARRLASRTTYVIVLLVALAGVVPVALLAAVVRNEKTAALIVPIIGIVWGWLTWTFALGALSIAATERPGTSTASAVLNLTLASFGSFLGVSLMVVGMVLLVLLALALVALIGLGGSTTAPILAILTPVFLVVGGVGLLLVVAVIRLAFAGIAVDSAGASAAVRRSWLTIRDRTADVALWLIGDAALVGGGVLALTFIVVVGAAIGVAVQAVFLLGGTIVDAVNDEVNLEAGVFGAFVWLLCIELFLSVVAGAVASFSTASAVGFYQTVSQPTLSALDRAPVELTFCDQCGTPRSAGSSFCDGCGAAVAAR
ncbi:MAG: hypothetical protein QOG43_2926 [Actinomycetota bacterium]|jgi:hypothetical protein|nr:hypothetical protein [Actinomycetota bacterium]